MKTEIINFGGNAAADITSEEVIVTDSASALDLLMTAYYEHGCNYMLINKNALCEEFFDLRTGIAGDVMQKAANHRMKLAVYGDFSSYTSKSLRDFIYECNGGSTVFFTETKDAALGKLKK